MNKLDFQQNGSHRSGGCRFVSLVLCTLLTLAACVPPPPPRLPVPSAVDSQNQTIALDRKFDVVAQDLLGPVGLALLPDGTLLIAEEGNGTRDNSAGVTLVTPDGRSGRLVSGLPSTRDAGDLAGVPLVSVAPDGDMIYVASFGQGHLWTLPVSAFTGAGGEIELPAQPFEVDDLGRAMVPLNNVQLTNPFDMTFDAEGRPVVSDASQNGIATTNDDGTTQFIHRFERIQDSTSTSQMVEAVPTGITRVGDEYFVTLFGGCPYGAASGQLVTINGERNQQTVMDGLNLPIDVVQAADGTLWLLEFAEFTPGASCFDGSGYVPETGRLSTVSPDGTRTTVLDNLDAPGAVLPAPDGSLYLSEVFSGRVVRIQPLAQEAATAQFRDVTQEAGLAFTHGAFQNSISMDPVAAMGAGLCWIDYNNDGWLDLYLVNSHALDEAEDWEQVDGLPHNSLFQNVDGHFVDVSKDSGTDLSMRGNGCVAADFNMDGLTDLYVTAHGPNALLWNNGDGTFAEGAVDAGVTATESGAQPEWDSAISVGDLNGDGWPDLFVAGYIDLSRTIPKPTGHFPQDFYGIPDRLYINLGAETDGTRVTFREVTEEVGLTRAERGLGSLFTDLDRDGDLDLYIANDGHPNRLYANDPLTDDPLDIGFRLRDLTETADVGDSGSGMGVTNGDYDGDGELDLFVTNWNTELNALYRNLYTDGEQNAAGDLTFQYSTYRIGMSGLGNNLTGWGTHLMDVDHDSDLDIITVNGHVPITDFAQDAQLVHYYRNRTVSLDGVSERSGEFLDWTDQAGLEDVGPLMARGSAAADYDNDGDLDIAINTIGRTAVLLQNETISAGGGEQVNWLMIAPDRFAPGLRVTLTLPDGRQLVRESLSGSSYLASEDPRLHFGLGATQEIERVEVQWMQQPPQVFENVAVNQILHVSP